MLRGLFMVPDSSASLAGVPRRDYDLHAACAVRPAPEPFSAPHQRHVLVERPLAFGYED